MEEDIWFASFVYQSFERYILCDWGDTCEEDKKSNNYAVNHVFHVGLNSNSITVDENAFANNENNFNKEDK